MSNLRSAAMISLPLLLLANLVTGCGGEDSETTETTGAGGSSTAGSGGTAGTAGAGAGGEAGSGGTSAGAGGTSAGAGGDAGAAGTAGAAGGGGAAGSPPVGKTSVRVAHLSPDAPAVDVCVTVQGLPAPVGPLFAAIPGGVQYGQVTAFNEFDPLTITQASLVEPGKDCTAVIAAFDVGELKLEGGQLTVAAIGEAGSTEDATKLRLQVYPHEAAGAAETARVEFFHTSPGTPAVDVKAVAPDGSLAPVFDNVSFPGSGGVDIEPVEGVTLAVGASPLADRKDAVLTLEPVNLPAGSLTRVFAIGNLDGSPKPIAALACDDKAAPENGLSKCAVLPELKAQLRVAHLSPDAPAVDACVEYGNSGTFIGPVLAEALADGIEYGQVSAFLAVPKGKITKVRLVAPDAADCATGIATFETNIDLVSGDSYTAAAVGELASGAPEALRIVGFQNTVKAMPGKVRVDFFHTSPGTPAVDVKAVAPDGSLAPVFDNVSFPGSTGADIEPVEGLTLTVGANPFTDIKKAALTLKATDLPADAALSVFAIGNLDDAPKPLAALACNETAPAANGLSACAILPELNAMVRVAHLSPNAPPVDACLSLDGTNFIGPVLNPTLANGLKYKEVASYIEAPIGTYSKLRLINPDNPNCSVGLVPDIDLGGAQLLAGVNYTLSVFGEVGSADAGKKLSVGLYTDTVTKKDGKVLVRFLHNGSGVPTVDVGAVANNAVSVLFPAVAFGKGTEYIESDPLTQVTLAAGVSPLTNPAQAAIILKPVDLAADQVITTIAIGSPFSQGGKPLEVLACFDSDMTSNNGLATCAVLEKAP
ncbi:MAG: DUF4397 domain-containing protein [Polyangiaceae bacterium]|jgi:hypothetical protein|nr:DUF4397 domain-containing protein [Polyangiaceae bacterium]